MKIDVKKENVRLDQYISEELDLSRSKVQKLIKEEKVLINGKKTKANYLVRLADEIEVVDFSFSSPSIKANNIDLDILYEDEFLMIINKPSGMVVHPAPGHYENTLVNALLYYFHRKESKEIRPGIVHRLDKDTSGVMVVAKTEKVHELLSDMIKKKEVERKYLAIVDGVIGPDSGTIDVPIGRNENYRQKMAATDVNSKNAVTHFRVLRRFSNHTLIECKLDTGRTHQIRVHLSYIGYPITNDPLYNKKKSTEFGQMLHSKSIRFFHPITGKELYYEVEPPKEFREKLASLELS